MAATFDDIRVLHSAHRRGELDKPAFERARRALANRVADAELVSPNADNPLRVLAALIGVFVMATCLAAWLLNDLTLALTLTSTCAAAFTIRAFVHLDE